MPLHRLRFEQPVRRAELTHTAVVERAAQQLFAVDPENVIGSGNPQTAHRVFGQTEDRCAQRCRDVFQRFQAALVHDCEAVRRPDP